MKVILIRDVARLGRKSEVKEVPDGHAINFLLPRKLAIIATKESLKRLTEETGKHATIEQNTQNNFMAALEQNKEKSIILTVDANEQGHLFKGIHADDVANLLNENGFDITRQNIVLETPIKSTGIHTIPLTQGKIKGSVQLEIVKK